MLNYSDHGNGEVLVFLHGFCSDLRLWQGFVAPFSEEYRIILLDLPGCGKSPLSDPSLNEWARSCWDTLSHLGIDECTLIGHSMGAYVALEMMAAAPKRVSRFVSFHSSPLADNDERRNNRLKQISFIDKYGPAMLVRQIIPALFHTEMDEEEILPAIRMGEEQTAAGLKMALESMAKRSDNRALLYASEIPILFISGRHDAILPIEEQKIFAASCRNAQLVELEHTAHMGMLEECAQSQSHLASFLAKRT